MLDQYDPVSEIEADFQALIADLEILDKDKENYSMTTYHDSETYISTDAREKAERLYEGVY